MKKLAALASLLALTSCSCFNPCCDPCDPCPRQCCYEAPARVEKPDPCSPQPHFWNNECCNPGNYAL